MTLAPGPPAAAPALDFAVAGAEHVRHAAVPTLALELAVEASGDARVHSLLLDVQVRIAARRRSYGPAERERLVDLFGHESQWATSVASLLWTNATLFVPAFERATTARLALPLSYDFEVSAARYLAALDDGAIPLELLFSGTVLHGAGGAVRAARLPLDREATFDLPVARWREAVDSVFPGTAWLRLDRERFERLHAFRARRMLPTWEATVDALLEEADA